MFIFDNEEKKLGFTHGPLLLGSFINLMHGHARILIDADQWRILRFNIATMANVLFDEHLNKLFDDINIDGLLGIKVTNTPRRERVLVGEQELLVPEVPASTDSRVHLNTT